MSIAVIVEFAGRIGSELDRAHLEELADDDFVPVPEIVCSVNPTKLGSISVAHQKARETSVESRLNDASVFDSLFAILNRVQVFKTRARHKIVLIILIDVLYAFHNR